MGRSGDTMVCGLVIDLHTGVGPYRSGRSAIPHGGVLVVAGQVRAGLTTVGTLRRYIRLGRYGAAAQLGRSGDTMSLWAGHRLAHGCRSTPLGTLLRHHAVCG